MKIYQTIYPTPSRVLGLVRLLSSLGGGPIDRGVLTDMMRPACLSKGPVDAAAIRDIIGAAAEIGLVEERKVNATTHVVLSSEASTGNVALLFRLLTRLLLAPEVNGGTNRFADVCAWLLSRSATTVPNGHAALKQGLIDAGFSLESDELNLKADLRVDMVLYWAKFLGLVRQTHLDACKGLVPDPSVMLERHLDILLPMGKNVSVNDFRERLGCICPVVDGGTVRKRVLERWSGRGNAPWPADHLSDAIAFALRRLQRNGTIEYWCPDDQRTFMLMSGSEKVAFLKRANVKDAV